MTWFLTTLQQWLLFTGAVLATGCVAWRLVVAPGAAASLGDDAARALGPAAHRVGRIALAASGAIVVAWLLRLTVQVMAFRDPFAPLRDDVTLLLFETFWGTVWIAQGVVVVALLVVVAAATRTARAERADPQPGAIERRPAAWLGAAAAVTGLVTTMALSSHAVGVDSLRALAVTADATHALAAGCWIGTLAVVLSAGRPLTDDPQLFAAQIHRFSPLALGGGITLVGMGGVLSWTHLHAVSELWTTTYGRLLSAKVALALAILALGFLNWRRGVPIAHTAEGASWVRRRASGEVLLAVAVLVVTSILVHAPRP